MRIVVIIIFVLSMSRTVAQERTFTVEQAIDHALKNNTGIQAAGYAVEAQKQMKKTSFDLPKTDVTLLYGQYNSYASNDNNITVTQSIPFASLGSQGKLNRALLASAELKKTASGNKLIYEVKKTYCELAYTYALRDLLMKQDSLFEGFFKAASLRYKTGEARLLEQTTAEVQRNEARNRIRESEASVAGLRSQLQALLNTSFLPDIAKEGLKEIPLTLSPDSTLVSANPSLAYARQQVDVADASKNVQKAKAAPDLLVGFFSQTLIGVADTKTGEVATSNERFTGFHVGVSIPLWFAPHQGRVRAAEYTKREAESDYHSYRLALNTQLMQVTQAFEKNKNSLSYYRDSALPNADRMLGQSQAAFRAGEIGYSEYLLGLRHAIDIKENHLKTLHEYNQSIIFIEFLSGNK